MYVWSVGSVAIPILIGIDFAGHLVWAIVAAARGSIRLAGKIVLFAAAADALLLALTFAAAVALLELPE